MLSASGFWASQLRPSGLGSLRLWVRVLGRRARGSDSALRAFGVVLRCIQSQCDQQRALKTGTLSARTSQPSNSLNTMWSLD